MLDNPKWLLFFLTFSVTSVIFMGLLDATWAPEGEHVFKQLFSINSPLDFAKVVPALWDFLTWDYEWMSSSTLTLVRYVFMVLQFGCIILIIYQGWKALRGY